MAINITKTYTDSAGSALAGSVVFTPYTMVGGKPVAGQAVVASLSASGQMTASLSEATIYGVSERIRQRGRGEMVVRTGDSAADLDELPRYGNVVEALLLGVVGIPAGGTTGQVLAKASDDDFDTEWVSPGS